MFSALDSSEREIVMLSMEEKKYKLTPYYLSVMIDLEIGLFSRVRMEVSSL